VGFSFGEGGVEVVDGETQEHHCLWAWATVYGVLPIRDSYDPTDMELFCMTVVGVGDLQLECNDAFALAKAFCDNAPAGVSPDAPHAPTQAAAPLSPFERLRHDRSSARRAQGSARRPRARTPSPAECDEGSGLAPPPPASICARGGPRGSVAALVAFVVGGLVAYCAVLDEHVDARTGGLRRPAPARYLRARLHVLLRALRRVRRGLRRRLRGQLHAPARGGAARAVDGHDDQEHPARRHHGRRAPRDG